VEVAWFDMKPEPIGPSEDSRVSLAGLKSAGDPHGWHRLRRRSDLGCCSMCRRTRGGPLAVHVLTDLQRTGFGTLEAFAFPQDVHVHVWDVGTAATGNVAVTEVRPLSLMVRADQPTTVQATILNAERSPSSSGR
jgi:hypothetical protein